MKRIIEQMRNSVTDYVSFLREGLDEQGVVPPFGVWSPTKTRCACAAQPRVKKNPTQYLTSFFVHMRP